MRVLVTGGAGFIGSHLCERLVARGDEVVAVDNFDPFYDPAVKRRNVAALEAGPRFRLVEADIRDAAGVERGVGAGDAPIDAIVHLAARAGIRPSLEQPALYADVNVTGTTTMLELARRLGVRAFVFGSSSSVYGNNEKVPFAEADPVDKPISPYAATKRAGELICHTYHHLYGTSVTCLRFFTAYGPRQRPDLAIHKFARMMLAGEPVPVFGDGSTRRDYTFVHDIVQGVEAAIDRAVRASTYDIINLGGHRTTSVAELVRMLGEALGVEPRIRWLPPQPGDVERTYADITRAKAMLGYEPRTSLEAGLAEFVRWLRGG